MPVAGTQPKYLSDLFSGPISGNSANHSFYMKSVEVFAVGDLELDPVGTPLIFDNTVDSGAGGFVPFTGQSISGAPAQNSTLPDQSPLCLVTGPQGGAGLGDGPIELTAGQRMMVTVLFRGPVSINQSGIEYPVAVTGPNKALFESQLEKQNIAVKQGMGSVATSYADYS